MKLALHLSDSGSQVAIDIERVLEPERLGFDSIWTAEAYGSDAIPPTKNRHHADEQRHQL